MGERESPNLNLVLDGGGGFACMVVFCMVLLVVVLAVVCMMCSTVCNVSVCSLVLYRFLAQPVAICRARSLNVKLLRVSMVFS